jgi:hypothetical protein
VKVPLVTPPPRIPPPPAFLVAPVQGDPQVQEAACRRCLQTSLHDSSDVPFLLASEGFEGELAPLFDSL